MFCFSVYFISEVIENKGACGFSITDNNRNLASTSGVSHSLNIDRNAKEEIGGIKSDEDSGGGTEHSLRFKG